MRNTWMLGIVLLLGCDSTAPLPEQLTIEPCGSSMDCVGEGSHEGWPYGWSSDCAFTFEQCRYFRADLLTPDGAVILWGENPVVPEGECVDKRLTGFRSRDFENWLIRSTTTGPGSCRTRRFDVNTFVQTRVPGFGGPREVLSVVVEIWDWMRQRWVQCWSVEPFDQCRIVFSDTPLHPGGPSSRRPGS